MTARILFSSTAIAFALFANPALALTTEAPDPNVGGAADAAAIDAVTVTATRAPQELDKVGASVTVLTQPAIEASQAVAVVDLLARTPGVYFNRNGGPGAATSVNIRGAEGQHTVVLIDGVKLNDPSSTQGGFNFGNLLVGDISRIEVLRGAQSTLWGSQAVGGVVNIVTAVPTRAYEVTADLEGGARNTGYARIGVGGASPRLVWRLAGGRYTTDGFSAYSKGTETDGYQNNGASGRIEFKAADYLSVEARSVYSDGKTDIDGFNVDSPEYARTREWVAYGGVNLALFDGRLKNRFGYALTETERRNLNPARPAAPLTFDAAGRNRRWEYQGSLAFNDRLTATFGAETERSRMRTRSPSVAAPNPAYGRGRVGVDSVYAQLQAEITGGLTLTGGLRYEDHQTYGDRTLGQAAVAWSLNEGATVLRASFGQGFRAPGLYELYSEYGNLDLAPESFDSWDAGIEQSFFDGKAKVRATGFWREADNEIRYNACTAASTDPLCRINGALRFGYYRNVLATRAKGLELEGSLKLTEGLSLSGNYTYTDAETAAGANTGKQLTRRPKHMGSVSATYEWPFGLSYGVTVRHVGVTFNNDTNTQRVAGYTVADFRVSYQLTRQVEVYGRVENLTDAEYETVLNYGTPGRGAFAGLRARF